MTNIQSYMEVQETITHMIDKLNRCGYSTKIFNRENYHDVLCVLSNTELGDDHTIHLKVNVQHGIITVSLRRKT